MTLSSFYLLDFPNTFNGIIPIYDSKHLDMGVKEALCTLNTLGIQINEDKVRYFIKTHQEMEELHESASGLCIPTVFKTYDIWVLEDLPYVYFKSVLAHELGHVWLFENEIKLNDMECEGFCQLLSHQILFSDFALNSNSEARIVAARTDEIYGDGFLLMKRKLDTLGWQQLLILLKYDI